MPVRGLPRDGPVGRPLVLGERDGDGLGNGLVDGLDDGRADRKRDGELDGDDISDGDE